MFPISYFNPLILYIYIVLKYLFKIYNLTTFSLHSSPSSKPFPKTLGIASSTQRSNRSQIPIEPRREVASELARIHQQWIQRRTKADSHDDFLRSRLKTKTRPRSRNRLYNHHMQVYIAGDIDFATRSQGEAQSLVFAIVSSWIARKRKWWFNNGRRNSRKERNK